MRIALSGMATVREINEYWDLDEVMAAHEILDIREDLAQAET